MSNFGSTYSFENKELLTITKNAEHFCTGVFCETLYKISRQTGKLFWYWRSGNMTIYDFYLFCF